MQERTQSKSVEKRVDVMSQRVQGSALSNQNYQSPIGSKLAGARGSSQNREGTAESQQQTKKTQAFVGL
jgi:hypothetical protein